MKLAQIWMALAVEFHPKHSWISIAQQGQANPLIAKVVALREIQAKPTNRPPPAAAPHLGIRISMLIPMSWRQCLTGDRAGASSSAHRGALSASIHASHSDE